MVGVRILFIFNSCCIILIEWTFLFFLSSASGLQQWYCSIYFLFDQELENYHGHELWFLYCKIWTLYFIIKD